jgi:hypothetical protein
LRLCVAFPKRHREDAKAPTFAKASFSSIPLGMVLSAPDRTETRENALHSTVQSRERRRRVVQL